MVFFKTFVFLLSALFFLFAISLQINAQTKPSYEVLTNEALTKVVPTSFYFAGQSAATQMRNAVAAKIGKENHVIAGLVDTSGYSTEISGKYEGFFIIDLPIIIGDKTLDTGAYGFGFAKEGKIHIFDLSSKEILAVSTINDEQLKRPRPLMMTIDAKGIRLYKGKTYVLISSK